MQLNGGMRASISFHCPLGLLFSSFPKCLSPSTFVLQFLSHTLSPAFSLAISFLLFCPTLSFPLFCPTFSLSLTSYRTEHEGFGVGLSRCGSGCSGPTAGTPETQLNRKPHKKDKQIARSREAHKQIPQEIPLHSTHPHTHRPKPLKTQ